jgi:hypothetical protein
MEVELEANNSDATLDAACAGKEATLLGEPHAALLSMPRRRGGQLH